MRVDIATANIIAVAEIRDDGCYEVQCPKGHRSYAVLQQQKFEVLFDIGACALLDGYYREAVSSFTSSLERFYEFFIRACLFERKHQLQEIDIAWKEVSKQSERQLGAFIFLFAYEFGKMPLVLKSKDVEFRNEVIHRGKIPNREEALVYGQRVLEIVRPAMLAAQDKFPSGVQRLVLEHLRSAQENVQQGIATATTCMPTIISLSTGGPSHHTKSLEEALDGLMMWTAFGKK